MDAVFNYDVPDENEYYIHRIGRTGRAKRHGVAYSLVSNITEDAALDCATRSRRWSSTTRASWSRLRPRAEDCFLKKLPSFF